jgi:hypothetical protein
MLACMSLSPKDGADSPRWVDAMPHHCGGAWLWLVRYSVGPWCVLWTLEGKVVVCGAMLFGMVVFAALVCYTMGL